MLLQTLYRFLRWLLTRAFIYLFIYFYFICHTIITKNIGKERKKKWRGDLTEIIGAYERLGLLKLWARAVSHQLKKRRRKIEDGKTCELFSYLLNNLIFSFFLKEERDWELRDEWIELSWMYSVHCSWVSCMSATVHCLMPICIFFSTLPLHYMLAISKFQKLSLCKQVYKM